MVSDPRLALILLFLAAVVFGIELVQVWFPPRTVSQNDIFAGWCGAVGGMLAWVFFGGTLVWSLEKFVSTSEVASVLGPPSVVGPPTVSGGATHPLRHRTCH
jgi:hypothetical protein